MLKLDTSNILTPPDFRQMIDLCFWIEECLGGMIKEGMQFDGQLAKFKEVHQIIRSNMFRLKKSMEIKDGKIFIAIDHDCSIFFDLVLKMLNLLGDLVMDTYVKRAAAKQYDFKYNDMLKKVENTYNITVLKKTVNYEFEIDAEYVKSMKESVAVKKGCMVTCSHCGAGICYFIKDLQKGDLLIDALGDWIQDKPSPQETTPIWCRSCHKGTWVEAPGLSIRTKPGLMPLSYQLKIHTKEHGWVIND